MNSPAQKYNFLSFFIFFFTGTISLTKAVLPQMLEQGFGNISVISSVAGKMGAPVSASYAMSKHAVQVVRHVIFVVVWISLLKGTNRY